MQQERSAALTADSTGNGPQCGRGVAVKKRRVSLLGAARSIFGSAARIVDHPKVEVVQRRNGECWEWTGASMRDGYGHAKRLGRTVAVHRAAAALKARRSELDGLHVLHTCDNPKCVRPDHLRVGTHADNMAEMHARGRARSVERKNPLTIEQQAVVCALRRHGMSFRAIAEKTGIPDRTVRDCWHRFNASRHPEGTPRSPRGHLEVTHARRPA